MDGVEVTQYEHDAFGRLVAVELPDATLIEYDLDANGRRVGRRVDSVLERAWVYDSQLDPVAELDDEGDVAMRFVYGSMPHVPDLIERGADTYRVITNHLGSVRLVVNATTGVIAQRLDYGPWGEVLVDTNPGFQPFGYAGGIYDPETGLVGFGAREYDAGLGRWISRDPALFGGGLNLFAYAANDPVNFVDHDGQEPAPSLPPGSPDGPANDGRYPTNDGGSSANGGRYPRPLSPLGFCLAHPVLCGGMIGFCLGCPSCCDGVPDPEPDPDEGGFTPLPEPICEPPPGAGDDPFRPGPDGPPPPCRLVSNTPDPSSPFKRMCGYQCDNGETRQHRRSIFSPCPGSVPF